MYGSRPSCATRRCAPRLKENHTERYSSSARLILHYDPAKLAEVQRATAGDGLVIENGEHSLEIEGDIIQSVRVIDRIIAEIKDFVE